MTNNIDYIRAYTEVNCLLEYLPKSYIDKLPKNLIELIKKQSNKQYNINIDSNKSLLEQNFSKKTKDLIAVIKYNYWSTEEEKKQLKKIFYENEKQYQEELKRKYNPDNIVINNNMNSVVDIPENNQEKSLVKTDELKWYKRLWNRIKNFFGK